MADFNDIKNIWQKRDVSVPAFEDMIKKIKKNRRSIILKNIFGSLSLVLVLAVVLAVSFGFDFEYLTTRVGIILMVLAILGALIMNTQLLKIILSRIDDSSDSSSYLKELIRYHDTQRIIQTKGITIYFLVLTTGLLLYLFEFFMQDKMSGLMGYALTIGWLAFVWFYLRPKTIKKQEEKIRQLIKQTEIISNQLHRGEEREGTSF